MAQTWLRFPCPQCRKIVQENWRKCLYCGCDLSAEKEKLAARRQSLPVVEPAVNEPSTEDTILPAVSVVADVSPTDRQPEVVEAVQPPVSSSPQPAPTPVIASPHPPQPRVAPPRPAQPVISSRPVPKKDSQVRKSRKIPVWGWVIFVIVIVACLPLSCLGVTILRNPSTLQQLLAGSNPSAAPGFVIPTGAPVSQATVIFPTPALAATWTSVPLPTRMPTWTSVPVITNPTAAPTTANFIPTPSMASINTPTAAPTTDPSRPRILSEGEINAAVQPFDQLAKVSYIKRSSAVEWTSGWCASSQEILDKNLQSITWEFWINDIQLQESDFQQSDAKDYRNLFCHNLKVVLATWPSGAFKLETRYHISQALNDGQQTTAPGTYFDDRFVYVTEDTTTTDPSTWPLVLQDTFVDNSNGWYVGDVDNEWGQYRLNIVNGKLAFQLVAAKKDFSQNEGPNLLVTSDFSFSLDMTRLSSTSKNRHCYGLYVRGSSSGDQRDYFSVCDDQQTGIDLLKNNAWTNLVPWQVSTAIVPNGTNNLEIIVKGSTIECYVNGKPAGHLDDTTSQGGLLGLVTYFNKDEQAAFEFDNFTIRVPLEPGTQTLSTATATK
jgi:hypothetical protein